ncbi:MULTISPECIES: hypothetical protein [Sphingomonas]|uniref:Uncharacterized protein n=1 Tax=Sphingomonas trueperi TaxID=53317 RepID=A0A7X5XZG5_9SPHN|nr:MULTISPECIES: hypothetical protein [Sphingomonas]NJB98243.1 hypothetical protein [Sphingomonas trueperi]
MPYYSLRITTGNDADMVELKEMYPDWHAPDYTDGSAVYIKRSLDLASLQRNVAAIGGGGGAVEVKKISKREFEWKKYQ